MAFRICVVLLCLVAAGSLGCRIENPPTRRELAQERKEINAQKAEPPPQRYPVVDDAERVMEACGRPASDTVQPIYDKIYNGPVRRMVYRGRQVVVIEYIPSLPTAHQTDVPAPFPPPERAPAYPPPNAVWRFQSARMENREFVTSTRLEIYLPCAARALRDEL